MARLPDRPPAPAPARRAGRPSRAADTDRARSALGIGAEPALTAGEWDEAPLRVAPPDQPRERWVPTPDELHCIASYAAGGMSPAHIANQFSKPVEKVQRVLRSKAIEPYLEGARAKVARRMEFGTLRLESMLDTALGNIEAVLTDAGHRDHVSTSRWVAEKALRRQLTPALTEDKLHIQVGLTTQIQNLIEERTLDGFAHQARKIPRDQLSEIRHLQPGSEAKHDIPDGIDTADLESMGGTSED